MVAALFAVGFVCAGLSASIVGSFADKCKLLYHLFLTMFLAMFRVFH